jgi:hypothetical protein
MLLSCKLATEPDNNTPPDTSKQYGCPPADTVKDYEIDITYPNGGETVFSNETCYVRIRNKLPGAASIQELFLLVGNGIKLRHYPFYSSKDYITMPKDTIIPFFIPDSLIDTLYDPNDLVTIIDVRRRSLSNDSCRFKIGTYDFSDMYYDYSACYFRIAKR